MALIPAFDGEFRECVNCEREFWADHILQRFCDALCEDAYLEEDESYFNDDDDSYFFGRLLDWDDDEDDF